MSRRLMLPPALLRISTRWCMVTVPTRVHTALGRPVTHLCGTVLPCPRHPLAGKPAGLPFPPGGTHA
jgi:hypothetical protein